MLFISIFITFVTGGPGGGRLRPLWRRSSDSVPAWGRNSLQAAAIWTPFVLPLKRPAAGSKTRDSSWKRKKNMNFTPSYYWGKKFPSFLYHCCSLVDVRAYGHKQTESTHFIKSEARCCLQKFSTGAISEQVALLYEHTGVMSFHTYH